MYKDQLIAQHIHACGCNIDWEKTRTLKVITKRFDREVREAIEIQYHKSGPRYDSMNLDDGRYVKTSFWTPFMKFLRDSDRTNKSNLK